jgi:hypothetical protein
MHDWASGGNVQCCWCFCSRPAPYSSTSCPGIAGVELIHWPTGPRDGWYLLFLSRWDCIFGTSSAWATQSASPPAQSRLGVVSGVDQNTKHDCSRSNSRGRTGSGLCQIHKLPTACAIILTCTGRPAGPWMGRRELHG